ncbi:hypothetical protein [Haloferax volcanii]|uniref:Uncharacterized protein n=1 Tax=Haloferax volcanii JCM 10717 TaxID=1227458 RepID=M0I9V7_HALVO|nr:hypothetical protein [Haloferax alexandrinus]ELZ93546.1 hypothetical protein C452_04978 [Haloferax alexandrinus JCM 10717]
MAAVAVADEHGGAEETTPSDDESDEEPTPPDADPFDNGEENEEPENPFVFEFSENARVTDYTWDDRTLTVTLEADTRTTFVLTDAGVLAEAGEGSDGEVPMRPVTVPSGETKTVEFTVRDTGTRLVTISADGTMWYTLEDGFGMFSGSAGWADVRAGVLAALATMTVIIVLTSVTAYLAMSRDYRQVM